MAASRRVGADAFASIRPSENPTFADRTSTTGTASSDPTPPHPTPGPSSSYSVRLAAPSAPQSNPAVTTLPPRGGAAFDFSGRRDEPFNRLPQPPGSGLQVPEGLPSQFRIGEGDLRPVPQGMGGGFGGNYIGSNHPAFNQVPRGAHSSGGGAAHPSGARYLPMFPGDTTGVGGGPSGPGQGGVFAGEPDPDHLPPFDLSQLQNRQNPPTGQLPRTNPPGANYFC
jgi:hypothetical protein